MNPAPTALIIKYVDLDVHAQTAPVTIAHQDGDMSSCGTGIRQLPVPLSKLAEFNVAAATLAHSDLTQP